MAAPHQSSIHLQPLKRSGQVSSSQLNHFLSSNRSEMMRNNEATASALNQSQMMLNNGATASPPNQSQMMLNNGATASAPNYNSLKGKMKQVVVETAEPPPAAPQSQPAANLFTTLQRQQFPSAHISTPLHFNINGNNIGQTSYQTGLNVGQSSQLTCKIVQKVHPTQSQVIHVGQTAQEIASQVMLELSKPIKSFTAFLNEDDDNDEVNAIITNQGEQLRRKLSDMSWKSYAMLVGAIEERAGQKLKQKEIELNQMMVKNAEVQQMAAQYRQESLAAQAKINNLENEVVALKAAVAEANARTVHNMNGPPPGLLHNEVAESSSFIDSGRGVAVEPKRLACKACDKQVANWMLWPCRHVGLCKLCDAFVRVCPVCGQLKILSIELGLP